MNVQTEVVLEKFSNIIWEQKCWAILQEDTSDELFDLFTDLEIRRLKWSWPFAPLAIGSFFLESSTGGEPTKPELLDRFKRDLLSKPYETMVSLKDYLLFPLELRKVETYAGSLGYRSKEDLRNWKMSRTELLKLVMESRLSFLEGVYEVGRTQPVTDPYKHVIELPWWGLEFLTVGVLSSSYCCDATKTTPDTRDMKLGLIVHQALKLTANLLVRVLSERCVVLPSSPN